MGRDPSQDARRQPEPWHLQTSHHKHWRHRWWVILQFYWRVQPCGLTPSPASQVGPPAEWPFPPAWPSWPAPHRPSPSSRSLHCREAESSIEIGGPPETSQREASWSPFQFVEGSPAPDSKQFRAGRTSWPKGLIPPLASPSRPVSLAPYSWRGWT